MEAFVNAIRAATQGPAHNHSPPPASSHSSACHACHTSAWRCAHCIPEQLGKRGGKGSPAAKQLLLPRGFSLCSPQPAGMPVTRAPFPSLTVPSPSSSNVRMSSLGCGAWPRSSSMARRTAAMRPAARQSQHPLPSHFPCPVFKCDPNETVAQARPAVQHIRARAAAPPC